MVAEALIAPVDPSLPAVASVGNAVAVVVVAEVALADKLLVADQDSEKS